MPVDYLQAGNFQRAGLRPIGKGQALADLALQHNGRGAGIQRHGLQGHARAAIFKAALVQRNAPMVQGAVHLDARALRCAALRIVQHHVAGKQARHAVGVVFGVKARQLHAKGQVLHHHAIAHGNQRCAIARALCHRELPAKARRIRPQPVPRGHLRHQATSLIRRFAPPGHVRPQQPVAVKQAARANQHHGAMPGQIADAVQAPLARGHHPAAAGRACWRCQRPLLQAHLPALVGQLLPQLLRGSLRGLRQRGAVFVPQGLQGRQGDVFLAALPFAHDNGQVPRHAGAGAGNQKRQHRDVPTALINVEKAQRLQHICPERAIQAHVHAVGLLLRQHGADDRCQRNRPQQGNGKPHGCQQTPPAAQQAQARALA